MKGRHLWLGLGATASWCGPWRLTEGTTDVLCDRHLGPVPGAAGVHEGAATAHYVPSPHALPTGLPGMQCTGPWEW